MSGANFNLTTKPPYAAQNTVFFTKATDLPAPSGGVIPFQENTHYVMYNDDPTASQKTITLSDRISIPDAGGVRISSVGLATCLLNYSGSGTFITTSSTFTGFLHIDEIFISAPTGTLFDIDGVLPVGSEFFPRIFLSNMGFFNTDTIGTIKTISVNMNVGAFFSCKQGLILDGIDEGLIGNWRFANWQNDSSSIMITAKNTLRFPKIDGCTFETQSNETAFNIEPSIGDEPFIIAGNSYRGSGTQYFIGSSGTITATTNVDQSGSVTAVSGTAFGECIMTDVAHGIVLGTEIITTGFSDSNYNGTFEVLEIIDADNFRIHALFTATGTGSWSADRIQFAAVNTMSVGDGVTVTGTTDYNAGYRVLGVSGTAFFVNGTFVSNQSGSFNTDSLTETDPRMKVEGNAGLDDSKTIAFGQMNTNTNLTTVTQSVYTLINVATTVENAVTQRFTLTNSAVGEFTYIGQEDLSGDVTAIVSATKTGSTVNYRFALSVNGVAPTFGSAPFSPMEVKTTKVSITVLQPLNIVSGDTIQIMIAGDGTGDDVTITDFVFEAGG